MLMPTHFLAAQTAYLFTCQFIQHTPQPIEAGVALLASTLPDLDSRQSYAGRIFPFISAPLEHHFGHRTITHSLLAQFSVWLLAWYLLPGGITLALMAGWISHSVADMMTPSGVAWFYPSRARAVLPGSKKYRMKVMGWGELAFGGVMVLMAVGFMMLARAGEGTGGLIKAAIGDITAARAQYDAEKGSNRWTLRIEGRDNLSHQEINGAYEVRGGWKAGGFIVDADQSAKSVCKASGCDWYADHAVLVRGEAEQTTTQRIKVEQFSVGALMETVEPWQELGEVYISGTAKLSGAESQLPTVDATEEGVSLSYARPERLEELRKKIMRSVDISVQVRYGLGTLADEIKVIAKGHRNLDPLLGKWVE